MGDETPAVGPGFGWIWLDFGIINLVVLQIKIETGYSGLVISGCNILRLAGCNMGLVL